MKTVYDKINDMRGNLIRVTAEGASLAELARIDLKDGRSVFASVLRIEGKEVTLQVFQDTRGISTADKVTFLKREMQAVFGESLLGRRLSGAGYPIDGGPEIRGESINIGTPSFNPVRRIIPREMVRTNIPMIDMFNTLVKSQKIPIFSVAGEPYNKLLMRIANQTDADVVIIAGMGLTFNEYQGFIDNAEQAGSMNKTVMFIHRATDPAVECILVPDMALACAEKFAVDGKHVIVLLTDMTAFADAIKEIAITMDQVPSNRGYPGSLYSDLASRYEKAVLIEGGGSITIIGVTTMPGDDVTHPVPDNTGYITEGQFYLHGGKIDPFGSLSRLKQLVIGKVTRDDHGDLANTMIRLYADSKKSRERQGMGFKLSRWDEQLLEYSNLFEKEMMNWNVNMPLEESLEKGWKMLAQCFKPEEVGIRQDVLKNIGQGRIVAEIKLTKNELRAQQRKMTQLQKYLPTLQLKKAMLQAEIYDARIEIETCEKKVKEVFHVVEGFSSLLSLSTTFEPQEMAKVTKVNKRIENIAGVDVPYFEGIEFAPFEYSLFDTPPWLDRVIEQLRFLAESKARVVVAEEKKRALEEELRMVSIRVNLFEKILIPRAKQNIKKIKVFLGDQELAAVSRAKVAKTKIEANKCASI